MADNGASIVPLGDLGLPAHYPAMIRARFLLALALLSLAGAAQAQTWSVRPDDSTLQADRLRLERERWRAGQDEREALARADQRRTDAVIYGIQAQRLPIQLPPPGPSVDRAPLADLHLMEQQAADAARDRSLDAEDRLDALRAWLERTRQP